MSAPRPDRSRAPAPGPKPAFTPPALERAPWGAVVPAPELGFVLLQAGVGVGHRFGSADEAGRAALLADLLSEGTRALDGTALVETLDDLGGTLDVRADDDEVVVELTFLARHAARGIALFDDLLFAPRFAAEDFERVQRQRLARIEARRADGAVLAAEAWRAVMFGADTALGAPPSGTPESIADLSVERLATAWTEALAAGRLRLAAVGPTDAAQLAARLPRVVAAAGGAREPATQAARPAARPRVTIVDRPGAPQVQLRVGQRAIPAAHPDYFPLVALNHPLGGALLSRLNLNLREERGWTYGVRSGFQGGLSAGWFQVATAVDSAVAVEATSEILREVRAYAAGGPTEEEVELTRSALARTLPLQYEAPEARAAFAANLGKYGWPADYPARRLAWLAAMDRAALSGLAERHILPDELQVVAVGDANQLAALEDHARE